jgi:hypothetical protein
VYFTPIQLQAAASQFTQALCYSFYIVLTPLCHPVLASLTPLPRRLLQELYRNQYCGERVVSSQVDLLEDKSCTSATILPYRVMP